MSDGAKDVVELRFCDLCGMSIPQKEIDTGLASAVGSKMVGACCLAKLVADLPATRVGSGGVAKPSSGSLSLLFATSVVVVAVLGAAWYLDLRAHGRDPSTSLGQLTGKVEALERIIEEQQRVLRLHGETVGRDVTVRLEPAMREVESQIRQLREAAAKNTVDLGPLQGRMSSLADQMGELAVRQGAVEGELKRALGALREELAQIDKTLREAAAVRAPSGDSPPRPGPGPEDKPAPEPPVLPAALAAKAAQLSSSDPGQRWAAADELIRSGDKRVVPHLLPLLGDADPFVRRLCAEGLAQVGDRVHCGALVEALDDGEAIVREAAYRALVKLSGQRLPFDAEAAEAARRGMVRRWQQWWEKESGKSKD